MYTDLASILAAILFGTLVGAQGIASESQVQVTNKTYALQDWYQAYDFFTQWSFFSSPDPTNGNVNYLSMDSATSQGIAYVNSENNSTVLAVDSTSQVVAGGYRDSVRITSNKVYTGGLFILDAAAMPVGCGTWPSFWTVGPDWPLAGEIDIVEGVNNQLYNQMTLHSGTSEKCTLNKTTSNPFTGHVLGTNCYSTQNADAGCSVQDTNTTSFSYGFNDAGGGVFALLWEAPVGMSMWHFTRAHIPTDITKRMPTPANWGTPVGSWSAANCDIADNFYNHSMIFDVTICGGWAGPTYSSSGCPGTCADMVANATNFADAKWVINYVAVYQ